MKKQIVIAALVVMGIEARAQTNQTPLNTPQSFGTSVMNYFTSFDTNSTTFLADKVDITMGAATVDNDQIDTDFLVEFNATRSLSLEMDVRNETIVGQVVSYQGGLGWNFVHYDTKLTGYIDMGYESNKNLPYVAPGLRVKKALSDNTYAMIALELPIYFRRESPLPTYIVGAGFKF